MRLVFNLFCVKLNCLSSELILDYLHPLWHLQQVFKVAALGHKNDGAKISKTFFIFKEILKNFFCLLADTFV